MLVLQWISVLALAVVAYADTREQPTELIINTTYLPPECPAKAGKGDSINVHYVN
jgi:FK506-binding protein 2